MWQNSANNKPLKTKLINKESISCQEIHRYISKTKKTFLLTEIHAGAISQFNTAHQRETRPNKTQDTMPCLQNAKTNGITKKKYPILADTVANLHNRRQSQPASATFSVEGVSKLYFRRHQNVHFLNLGFENLASISSPSHFDACCLPLL